MMMSSSEFKTLIERNVGEIYFEDTISKNRFSQLRLFLEKELGVKVPDQWSSTMTYIDLWRKVNSLTENKQNNQKGKGIKMTKNNSVVIVNSKPNPLPVSNKIAEKITDISSQIEDDKEDLNNYLDEIQNATPSIDIGSFLGFLPVPKKGDVEKAIFKVYSSLCEYIVKCGDALRSANGNISNILELIQLLATAEADIYKLIDDQSLASNELRALIKDWCKEHGIHDDEVDKLLESSFQRAYTLRDRLNNLREELYKELDNNKESVENILKELPNYQAKIQKSTDDTLAVIKESKEKSITDIDHHYAEKERELEAQYNLLSSNAKKVIDRVETMMRSLDENEVKFDQKVASYFAAIAEKEKNIQQQSQDIKAQFSSVVKELSDKGEATEKELKLMREGQEWFKKDINKTLDEKFHGFADLHKQFIMDQTSIMDKLEHQVTTYKIVAIIAGVVSVASIVVAIFA